MARSVYSLVLTDEVVEKIDLLAARSGMSRSAYINSVLAEKAGLSIGSVHRRSLYALLQELMQAGELLQPVAVPSQSCFAVRGVLPVKYRPAIRYSVVLDLDAYPHIGELRVECRTQAPWLMEALRGFFDAFSGITSADYTEEAGRFRCVLVLRGSKPPPLKALAQGIRDHILCVDSALQAYLTLYPDEAAAYNEAARIYAQYASTDPLIL